MRVLVAGAAGFLGSHLVDKLLADGHSVVGLDDLSSGSVENLRSASESSRFVLHVGSITDDLPESVFSSRFEAVFNLASPASPPRYRAMPLHTLKTGSIGSLTLLEIAAKNSARFVMASTSEVYGDPEVHPQVEEYFGHVNPVGERSCYDEAKRFSEALCYTYRHSHSTNVGIARIFNTYGPRLSPVDGRLVSSALRSAITGDTFTVYGTGNQTRSLCFVSDLINGLLQLAASTFFGPFNLGNPVEISVNELVRQVEQVSNRKIAVRYVPPMSDDPSRRRPDITRAERVLGWMPSVTLEHGLTETYHWMRAELES